MKGSTPSLEENLSAFIKELGDENKVITKRFIIGKTNPVNACAIYINGIVDKNIISRDILKPLMESVVEDILNLDNSTTYLCERYIYISDTYVEEDISKAVDNMKKGYTVVIINGVLDFIIVNTVGGITRDISEPMNESAIRGSREGFVESLQMNIGILRRHIKDKNFKAEILTIGTRTQTDLALIYIDDIVDKDIVSDIRIRISKIDIDSVQGVGIVEQLIEKYPYTFFPQILTTERPDRVIGNIMEGRIAIILDGTPFIALAPVLFSDFFQSIEDYFERTLISSFIRLMRFLSAIIVILLPSVYLAFIRFNPELLPLKLLTPIVQSRKGIPLPPLLEILSMEIVIEFLREGGLRLPSKIGQTLSVVGGFIIGDAAIRARIVSPATLVVVGVATIATFVIPNYEMSLTIRLIRFPMLILANFLGALGLIAGVYVLMIHLYSIDSFGVPYWPTFKFANLKDTLIRVPLWKMNKRSESIPNNNPIRQTNFRKKN
jgi:hypothetical protein